MLWMLAMISKQVAKQLLPSITFAVTEPMIWNSKKNVRSVAWMTKTRFLGRRCIEDLSLKNNEHNTADHVTKYTVYSPVVMFYMRLIDFSSLIHNDQTSNPTEIKRFRMFAISKQKFSRLRCMMMSVLAA